MHQGLFCTESKEGQELSLLQCCLHRKSPVRDSGVHVPIYILQNEKFQGGNVSQGGDIPGLPPSVKLIVI